MGSIDLYTTSTLLRYVSEWDPRENAHTKGGYIDGEIRIPDYQGPMTMIVKTFPPEDVETDMISRKQEPVHPCLLHVVRMGKGKRDQQREPVPTHFHWYQKFEIKGSKVNIVNRTSELDVEKDGTPRQVPIIDTVTELQGNTIVMGRKRGQLNLIILQPKQKNRAKPSEATLTKVLADRMNASENDPKVDEVEKMFKGKKSKNLKRIRLHIEFLDAYGNTISHSVSPQTVIDTGSKEIGAMDFYDVIPRKSCTNGGRKVVMISEYSLSKDVKPVFQVFDKMGNPRNDQEVYINQPEPSKIHMKNEAIIFISPPQPNLHEIWKNIGEFDIKLRALRTGDGYLSSKSFSFRYDDHHDANLCFFCDLKVDTDEKVHLEEGIPRPKPKRPKRVMNHNILDHNISRKRKGSQDDEFSVKSEVASEHLLASPKSQYSNGSFNLGSPTMPTKHSNTFEDTDANMQGSDCQSESSSIPGFVDLLDNNNIDTSELLLNDINMNQGTSYNIPIMMEEKHANPQDLLAACTAELELEQMIMAQTNNSQAFASVEDVVSAVGIQRGNQNLLTNEEETEILNRMDIEAILRTQDNCFIESIPVTVQREGANHMTSHGSVTVVSPPRERQTQVNLMRRNVMSQLPDVVQVDSTSSIMKLAQRETENELITLEEGNTENYHDKGKAHDSTTKESDNTKKDTQEWFKSLLEDIPTFVFLFMVIFMVLTSFINLPTGPLMLMSCVVSMGIIYSKNRPTASIKED